MNSGLILGISCYIMWGLFPLYWYYLSGVPSLEILGYRIVGALAFIVFILAVTKKWKWIKDLTWKQVRFYMITSVFITINWLVYIWSVTHKQTIESSLGYYINPLVNASLGALFLHERLRKFQYIPIIIAAIGVGYITYKFGKIPLVSLILAFSFSIYGLLKKKGSLEGIESFTLESFILSFPALAYLIYLHSIGNFHFGIISTNVDLLLIGAGTVTAIPLILYNLAARKLTLTTVGMLQYISPTMQLILGVLFLREPFPRDKVIGFIIIWIALLLYTIELIYNNNQKKKGLSK